MWRTEPFVLRSSKRRREELQPQLPTHQTSCSSNDAQGGHPHIHPRTHPHPHPKRELFAPMSPRSIFSIHHYTPLAVVFPHQYALPSSARGQAHDAHHTEGTSRAASTRRALRSKQDTSDCSSADALPFFQPSQHASKQNHRDFCKPKANVMVGSRKYTHGRNLATPNTQSTSTEEVEASMRILVPHYFIVDNQDTRYHEAATMRFREKYGSGLLQAPVKKNRVNHEADETVGNSLPHDLDTRRNFVCSICKRTPKSDNETRDKAKWSSFPGENIKCLCPCCGIVENILDHEKRRGRLIFRVKWLNSESRTWVPADSLHKDMIEEYFHTLENKKHNSRSRRFKTPP